MPDNISDTSDISGISTILSARMSVYVYMLVPALFSSVDIANIAEYCAVCIVTVVPLSSLERHFKVGP